MRFNLFISVYGQLTDEGSSGTVELPRSILRLRTSADYSAKVEVFIYMRLSLLHHSASATIAPAGSPWTNDSQRALNTKEDVVSARTI